MSHRFDPVILREYDVRGTVGRTLHAADGYAIGRCFATRVAETGGGRVVVGRDGRLTSEMLEAALVRGLTEGGVDVVRIGLGPSPMLYFAEAVLPGMAGGIQVTGSHNPRDDNGFKMVLRHRSLHGPGITALGALAESGRWSRGAGTVESIDLHDAYVDRLLQGQAPGRAPAFRIGWDCGSGAAGPVVERLTARLPGEHHLLHIVPDGHFPHHHPDPSDAANLVDLQALVAERGLDFGLAFDGDGDRIGAVDGRGRILWGDQILMLLAERLLLERPGATVVGDVKSSRALFDRIAQWGGTPVMGRTGHSSLKTLMADTGAPLAGEMSGHIFFGQEYYGFDDALYAAVRLIRAIDLAGRSLTDLHDAMPRLVSTPDLRIPVPESRKWAVVDSVATRLAAEGVAVDTTDGLRVSQGTGWWLLRPSNTQAAVTVRAEATDADDLATLLAGVEAHLAACGVAASLSGETGPT